MIAGLGSNGFAWISSKLFEILKDKLDVVGLCKVSVVTGGMNAWMIVDGLSVDVENLFRNRGLNIFSSTQAEVVLSAE